MYDQAYNAFTLVKELKKSDFDGLARASHDAFRASTVEAAIVSAQSLFGGANPIQPFHLKKKSAYKIGRLSDDLVVRKLARNIRWTTGVVSTGRSYLVSNLRHFLEEGVPYKLYKLDIRSFYESFLIDEINARVQGIRSLSPQSKLQTKTLLNTYAGMGGKGLPRGMALSAVLSDFMMTEFDEKVRNEPFVYLYGRYVDDIVVITNQSEDERKFLESIRQWLPKGLKFNEKKTAVFPLPDRVKVLGPAATPAHKFNFDYLGYQFSIFDPPKKNKKNQLDFRLVRIEIASSKIQKIKLRLVRAFVAFGKRGGKEALLLERIKYLTSNFSIVDKNTGKRKLAGIYFSYPYLSADSKSLNELDRFLRNAVLSGKGKIFSKTSLLLGPTLKRKLLSHSFMSGHVAMRFVYFTTAKIAEIQRCWLNE